MLLINKQPYLQYFFMYDAFDDTRKKLIKDHIYILLEVFMGNSTKRMLCYSLSYLYSAAIIPLFYGQVELIEDYKIYQLLMSNFLNSPHTKSKLTRIK